MTEKSIFVRIEGRVQGVWFRGWTVDAARARNLRGWVRNRTDGAVEALFTGPGDLVDDMVDACHKGPPAARVDRVETGWTEDDGSTGFDQAPTE